MCRRRNVGAGGGAAELDKAMLASDEELMYGEQSVVGSWRDLREDSSKAAIIPPSKRYYCELPFAIGTTNPFAYSFLRSLRHVLATPSTHNGRNAACLMRCALNLPRIITRIEQHYGRVKSVADTDVWPLRLCVRVGCMCATEYNH